MLNNYYYLLLRQNKRTKNERKNQGINSSSIKWGAFDVKWIHNSFNENGITRNTFNPLSSTTNHRIDLKQKWCNSKWIHFKFDLNSRSSRASMIKWKSNNSRMACHKTLIPLEKSEECICRALRTCLFVYQVDASSVIYSLIRWDVRRFKSKKSQMQHFQFR